MDYSTPGSSVLHCLLAIVQSLSCVQLFATPWTAACPAPCPSSSVGVCSNSHPLSQWCHLNTSVIRFSSCIQSFPASGSFPMSQLFTSSGQSIGVSASASVLPINIQDWFPLGMIGLTWSLLKFMSIESGMLSNHFILYCPFLLVLSVFPSIRVFSNVLILCIRWPQYWSFSFSISPSNEYSGLISITYYHS